MSKLGNKIVKWFYNGNTTTCVIQEQGQNEPIVTGEVVKYAKDIANKRLGRKLSFKNAMTLAVKTNSISKEERSQIWNDFRNNINQPELI